jgi:cytochrome c oxidase subunit 3
MENVIHGEAGHHEVELSAWPLVVGLSSFLVPIAFMTAFQWKLPVLGIVLGGAAVLGILIGLFGWVSQAQAVKTEVGLSKVAILLFITSEFILFGGLFGGYFYTWFPSEVWPPANTPQDVPPLGTALILSVFLLSSSLTIHKAETKLHEGNKGGFIGWLFFTTVLGAIFLLGQANEWAHLIGNGFTALSNPYGTFFYTITGFHGSHVLVGLVIQIFILLLALGDKVSKKRDTIMKACGYYWHFVDGIWLLVLSLIYILPFYMR